MGRPAGSLRGRLLFLVSIATLIIWIVAAAMSYRQARHEVRELMDSQMAQSAALLLAQAAHGPEHLADLANEMALLRGVRKRRNELTLEFVVVAATGEVLASSTNGPGAQPAAAPLGYADIDHKGERWRSLTLATGNDGIRILVAQSIRLRDREALEIAIKTVLPLVLFIPILIGLIYFSVRRGLKPLDDLAEEVASRSSENLQALTRTRVPREAQPLVLALNRLLHRLQETLENERRFTADAAHELRTPLAAVRVQAQVALASPAGEARTHALNQVLAGTDRATRLVEQLLRLARLDPLARLPAPHPLDLAELARIAVADVRETDMPDKSVQLEIPSSPVPVSGDRDLLMAALRNLVDNAVRYTPPGSHITVFARMEHGEPVLGVADDGPGVPAEELPKLIERFYRGRDNTSDGSGLGLAIVRRIAELHDARIEVDNRPEGGFMVQLRWCRSQGQVKVGVGETAVQPS
jgi:two-component system sensor histidine kinase QseC